MAKRIGIFGGSFNPIHIGHAIIANYVMQNTDLDQLWLMVSPQNPLKADAGRGYDQHRLMMADLVARRIEGVSVSGFEFSLPRPSYTIDTLNELQQRFPNDEFSLIIGADNWAVFNQWKSHDEILSKFGVIIYPRRGYEISIPASLSKTVRIIDAPVVEVSSTGIREGIKAMRNMSFFLTDDVYRYILEKQLYQ